MPDLVNHPPHYTTGAIECIEAIEASMTPEAFKGFLKGNCIKYLYRHENKNGLEDLKKCKWYLDRLIATVDQERASMEKTIIEDMQVSYDPDDYMASGCPSGFRPFPAVRQGPPEELFQSIS